MTSASRWLTLVLIGAAGSTGGLAAQVRGLPVRNAGVGTGLGIAGDIGFPSASAGKGIALGATGAVGLGPLGITGTVATWNPKGPAASVNSMGVTGNLKIFGGPLVPLSVTLQAGAAYDKVGSIEDWHLPVGLGIALTIPNPVFSIKPWVAPRLDVTRTSGAALAGGASSTNTDTNFGISGGVDLGFLSGLAVRVMYDRVNVAPGVHPSVISLGLGFKVGT